MGRVSSASGLPRIRGLSEGMAPDDDFDFLARQPSFTVGTLEGEPGYQFSGLTTPSSFRMSAAMEPEPFDYSSSRGSRLPSDASLVQALLALSSNHTQIPTGTNNSQRLPSFNFSYHSPSPRHETRPEHLTFEDIASSSQVQLPNTGAAQPNPSGKSVSRLFHFRHRENAEMNQSAPQNDHFRADVFIDSDASASGGASRSNPAEGSSKPPSIFASTFNFLGGNNKESTAAAAGSSGHVDSGVDEYAGSSRNSLEFLGQHSSFGIDDAPGNQQSFPKQSKGSLFGNSLTFMIPHKEQASIKEHQEPEEMDMSESQGFSPSFETLNPNPKPPISARLTASLTFSKHGKEKDKDVESLKSSKKDLSGLKVPVFSGKTNLDLVLQHWVVGDTSRGLEKPLMEFTEEERQAEKRLFNQRKVLALVYFFYMENFDLSKYEEEVGKVGEPIRKLLPGSRKAYENLHLDKIYRYGGWQEMCLRHYEAKRENQEMDSDVWTDYTKSEPMEF
mmetsp:Transcript_2906/g.5104  ORF Transcript_2906/g.5104 Transcript_2906/m.5104 type:complete len:503 (-) Transcript_2906:83-1591(-)